MHTPVNTKPKSKVKQHPTMSSVAKGVTVQYFINSATASMVQEHFIVEVYKYTQLDTSNSV
jgi:hypothetical protein